MRSLVVVVVDPRVEAGIALLGVRPVFGVGPLVQGGLDEAFGLAVGSWRIGPGAAARWAHLTHAELSAATLLAGILATLIGIPAASIVAREAGKDDPSFVVLDEVAGQWIALAAATPRWQEWLLAFLLFRGLDIWKPAPARQFDRMHSGFGIMMDDVAAGVYAALIVLALRHWL